MINIISNDLTTITITLIIVPKIATMIRIKRTPGLTIYELNCRGACTGLKFKARSLAAGNSRAAGVEWPDVGSFDLEIM